MSTKTTLKRIALVAVSTLGLSFFSVMPQASAYSANIALGWSSVTAIDTSATGGSTKGAYFYVDNLDADGVQAELGTSESITATVTGVPTDPAGRTVNTGDLSFQAGTVVNETKAFTAVGGSAATTLQIPNATAATAFDSTNETRDATNGNDLNGRYWFKVFPTDGDAVNAGEFTVTIRLHGNTSTGAATSFIVAKTLKVKFVSNAEDSGAVITVARTGDLYTGSAFRHVTNEQMTATLRDANSGRLQVATDAYGSSAAPTLVAQVSSSAGALVGTAFTTVSDVGTEAVDYVASATAAVAVNTVKRRTRCLTVFTAFCIQALQEQHP